MNAKKDLLRSSQRLKRKKVLKHFNRNTINPFINTTPTNGLLEKIKIVVLGLTLFPIRLICFIFLVIIAYLLATIALWGLDRKEILEKPLPQSRRIFLKPLPYLFRALLFLMGYYWIQVKGKPDKRAPIIVLNHVAFMEAFYILYTCFPHMVAKRETIDIPIIGKLFQILQPILVDRSSSESRKATAEAITKRAKNTEGWNQIAIFPEGTCTNGTVLINFKAGAFNPGVPVQPVVVRLRFVNFDPHYVMGLTGVRLFFQSFCQIISYMQVEFLPVYFPSEEEKQNPLLYANNVRKVMAKALNVGVSDHTFEDVIMQMEAVKRNINIQDANIESSLFRTLLSSNQFTSNDIKSLLTQFAEMDDAKSGRITFEKFCATLKLPPSDYLKTVFNLMDVDEAGFIDFREFITGKALIAANLTDEESLNIAFDSFDLNKDGFVDLEELSSTLTRVFPNINEDDIQSLFKKIEKEEEDRISRAEFNKHMKKYPEYMGILLSYKSHSAPNDLNQISGVKKDI